MDIPHLADYTCLKTVISDSVLLPEPPCHTLVTCSKHCHHPTRNNEYSDLSRASQARVYTSYEMESHAVTVRPKSLYEDVHASTGHPGYISMRWHQQNTIGANYIDKDAAAASIELAYIENLSLTDNYLDLAKSRGRIGSIADQQCLYQLPILCN